MSLARFHFTTFAENLRPLLNNENQKSSVTSILRSPNAPDGGAHPAWKAFIKYCSELNHGEIELLKIQNGLPMLAEITRKKVKFGDASEQRRTT